MRSIPMALIMAAVDRSGFSMQPSNQYLSHSGDPCFGMWGDLGALMNIVYAAALTTMEPEYREYGSDLGQMLSGVKTQPLAGGMTMYFPGWLAVDAAGMAWKDEDFDRYAR